MATPCAISKNESTALAGSATPFLQHLKVTLQSKLSYSPAAVLNTPYSQAIWDYYTLHEIEGTVDIDDSEDRKKMAEWIDANHDDLIKKVVEMGKGNADGP